MKKCLPTESIDLTLYFGTSLLGGSQLEDVQRILMQLAPEWTSNLHLWRFREPRLLIDTARRDALQRIALSKGIETGSLYRQLIKLSPPTHDRRIGSMELRGTHPGLTVVIGLDDWTFCPSGGRWLVGNQIAIQVRCNQIEGCDAAAWVEVCLKRCCSRLDLLFGFACASGEYEAKNISTEGGGLRAIGVDIARYLPGLYWLNFFGGPYAELFTTTRLMSAPECQVNACGSGYVLKLSQSANDWNLPEYTRKEELIRQHLGERYFFIRQCARRETVSPFKLPVLSAPRLSVGAEVDRDGVVSDIRIRERPK